MPNNNSLSQNQAISVFPLFCATLYVACSIFGNILSTKIVLLPSVLLEVDAGTIVYPLAFVARDMLHKNLGRRVALQVVTMNAFFILGMAFLFWLVGLFPSAPTWPYQEAYLVILTPVWRIVIASIIAEFLANVVNTYAFSAIIKTGLKRDMLASLISNSLAMIVDSLLFSFMAFWGSMPLQVVLNIMLVNIVVKGLVAVVGTPLVRLAPNRVNRDLL